MSDEQRQNGAYTKSEMVRIAIEDQVQPDPVPASWVGTSLLPAGTKKATKAQVAKADGADDTADTTPAPDPDAAPSGNASRDDWAAYATAQGAPEAETRPQEDGGLSRDELRDKYKPAGA